MKRMTILLTEELVALIELERRRRGVPAAVIVRDALDDYFSHQAAPASIVGVGRGAGGQTARDAEAILTREWTYERLMGAAESDAPSESNPNVDRPGVHPSIVERSKAS